MENQKTKTAKSGRLENFVIRCVEKYDWFIYRRAYNTIKRMCKRNAGFAYLMELHIKKYRELHPISSESERATELFFEAFEEREKEFEREFKKVKKWTFVGSILAIFFWFGLAGFLIWIMLKLFTHFGI